MVVGVEDGKIDELVEHGFLRSDEDREGFPAVEVGDLG
jgi:hypothetical protein